MITVTDAAKYSTNGEVAYQITYSDNTKVRAVESTDGTIRKEYLDGSTWTLVGKPYTVKRDKKRIAEKIKDICVELLSK